MAIMPHCVVCGFYSGVPVTGSVDFADYSPEWEEPRALDGALIIGWSNSLGVTAPEGVGLFCQDHLPRARRLRKLPSREAVARLRDEDSAPRRSWARLVKYVVPRRH